MITVNDYHHISASHYNSPKLHWRGPSRRPSVLDWRRAHWGQRRCPVYRGRWPWITPLSGDWDGNPNPDCASAGKHSWQCVELSSGPLCRTQCSSARWRGLHRPATHHLGWEGGGESLAYLLWKAGRYKQQAWVLPSVNLCPSWILSGLSVSSKTRIRPTPFLSCEK